MTSAPPSPTPTLLRPPSFHPSTVTWSPGTQPRYVVINPMHIVTLQDRTKTFAVRVVEKIKAFSERWFSHVLLLIFLLIYATLGALLFQWLEAPGEIEEKQSVNRTKELVIESLWQNARVKFQKKHDWYKEALRTMDAYESQIEVLYCSGVPQDSHKIVWSFWRSMFYAGTVFTTIGYGNMVPVTATGRAVTIIYAFIGIPFLLMVLADLGRLFTRAIKIVLYYSKLLCQTGKIKKARKIGRRATAVPVQYISVAWNKMPYQNRGRKQSADITSPGSNVTDDIEAGNNNVSPNGTEKKNPKDRGLENNLVENQESKTDESQQENLEEPKDSAEEVDDEFNFPVSLAVVLLIAYMMLGAFMFTLWEDWTFFDSFYFVFISMSTIGFGDLVPDHPIFMMCTFIYLLFGLALTSMCINVIQEKLSATFEMAKLRIGTTIGLDANMLIDVDPYTEKGDSPDTKCDSLKSRRGSKASGSKTSPDKGNIEALPNKSEAKKSKTPDRNTDVVDESGTVKPKEGAITNHK